MNYWETPEERRIYGVTEETPTVALVLSLLQLLSKGTITGAKLGIARAMLFHSDDKRIVLTITPETTIARIVELMGADLPQSAADAQDDEPQQKEVDTNAVYWDFDWACIVADFQREYGLDLYAEADTMHWWRFVRLLRNLSAESSLANRCYWRGKDLAKEKDPKERDKARQAKKAATPAEVWKENNGGSMMDIKRRLLEEQGG